MVPQFRFSRFLRVLAPLFLVGTLVQVPPSQLAAQDAPGDPGAITAHADALAFWHGLSATSDDVRVREFGTSAEGRPLLEVVISRPGLSDPWEAHHTGRPVVLVNALVHGDEPAGKEALMSFATELVHGSLTDLPRDVVFVLSPELNPDGGAMGSWGSRNSPRQRNINRDYLRLDSPETRAFVPEVIAAWHPHVIIDLHELVGPPRIYDFYTSDPLDVAGPRANRALVRRGLVPAIVEALEAEGYTHFPYHRVPGGLVDDPSRGVSAGTYGARALSSYGGAQAAMTLLFESMRPRDAREGLADRVRRHEVALEAMARWVAENADEVVRTVGEERRELVDRGAVMDPADSLAIRVEELPGRTLPYMLQVDGDTVRFDVPVLDSARIELGRVRPVAYVLEPHRAEAARHLALHGVRVDRLLAPARVQGESYRVTSVERAPRAAEGWVARSIRTETEFGELELPAGSWLVRMDQSRARVIGHLMEPEDTNSLASMGWFTTEERVGALLPLHRLHALPEVATETATATDHRGAPRWTDIGRAGGDELVSPEVAAAAGASPLRDTLTPHEDVVGAFRSMEAASPWVSMREIGRSREDRPLHLVTLSRPAVNSPAEAHASGRPILFIGAQVHGDEPAGKEGLLRFARDLVEGPLEPLLDELVVLLVPQMNPDGAEAGRWGTRSNRANFNLNRDYLKLDNPESRAVVNQVLLPWRPHVTVDAHELGGPPRVYDFYTWFPTNPHGPRATVELAGERLVPAIVDALEADGHSHIIYHTPGGLVGLPEDPERGISVPVYGRTLNDYAASQGLATILFESLRAGDARVGIEDRAVRQHLAMTALARRMAEEPEIVLTAFREGREEMIQRGSILSDADSIAVLREPVASRRVEYEVATRERVETPDGVRWEWTGETTTVETPVFDSARTVLGRVRPTGYLIEPHRGDLVRFLLDHGLVVERVQEPGAWEVESFRVDELDLSSSAYEGYIPQRFRTSPEAVTLQVPAGAWFVRSAQPGAALLFHLMEPEDENSAAIMGMFLDEARTGGTLPVHRVLQRSPSALLRILEPEEGR
ncbi:MAG: hypothetical protein EA352_01525 [Gemmatimonadales bacterium]|nr:MAG: hypothetical protein EA352_01525 [Gemmatimonadales bacterium]